MINISRYQIQNHSFKPIVINLLLIVIFFSVSLVANKSYAVDTVAHCAAFSPDTHGVVDGCSTGGADIALGLTDPVLLAFGAVARNDFYSSCNSHDRCYYEIGTSKATCDNRFNSDMANACSSKYPDTWKKITKVIEQVPIKVEKCVKTVPLLCGFIPILCGTTCVAKELVTVGYKTVETIVETIQDNPPSAAELLLANVTWQVIKSAENTYCEVWRQAYYGGVKQDPLNISRPGYAASQKKTLNYAQGSLGLGSDCASATDNTTNIRTYQTAASNSNLFNPSVDNIGTLNTTNKENITSMLLTAYLGRGPTNTEIWRYGGIKFNDFLVVPQVGANEICYTNINAIPPVAPPTINILRRIIVNGNAEFCVTAGTGDPNWMYPYINSLYNNGAVVR